jgi:clusterin-associated protein 1
MGLRDTRSTIVAKPFDIKEMEVSVSHAITQIRAQTTETQYILDSLVLDEANLTAKIEKKRMDLDRATKRFSSLKVVRPAYMDEYERIEAEIAKHYAVYMQKYRNLTYIEHQLSQHEVREADVQEEAEVTMKRMQSRLREEENRMLRGDEEEEFMGSGSLARNSRPSGMCVTSCNY